MAITTSSGSGERKDVVDSASFDVGRGATAKLSGGTGAGGFDYSIMPGNLGEAWLGTTPTQF